MSSIASPASDEAQLEQLLAVAVIVLQQGIDLVEKHLTSDDQLTRHSQYIPGSTIGKHLRHARDHFVLLADSVSSSPPYELSYDVRLRNTPMESSLKAAQDAFADAITRMKEVIPKTRLNAPVILHAVTPYAQTVQTTFGRELWFASLHCVHHWSMVRVIACEVGVKLEDDFGFAPSTLVAQGKDAAPLGKARI